MSARMQGVAGPLHPPVIPNHATTEVDPLLGGLAGASTAVEQEEALAHVMISIADPIIGKVLRRVQSHSGFSAEDAEDLRSTIYLRLLERLQGGEPIRSIGDFVGVATYHAFDDLLRRRYPGRASLKNRIRYLLSVDERFVTLVEGRTTWCGIAGADFSRRDRGAELAQAQVTATMTRATRPGDAIEAVLRLLGVIALDDLVRIAASLWGVAIGPAVDQAELLGLLRTEPGIESRLSARQSLQRLWIEIRALSSEQRMALLLNLRDEQGGSAIPLLVLSGVATVDDLAASLDLGRDELEALWPDLPLDDERIALRLGVTRRQIINLRKSARERLARRRARGGY